MIFAFQKPAPEQLRVSKELKKQGCFISPGMCVRLVSLPKKCVN
ncbi:hypothetical protein DB41_HO00010 [Neochlamydia sp. TUME1]|nr:hypothetical protein DB41_HO00010 [Neochlamydia sp. TUME1]